MKSKTVGIIVVLVTVMGGAFLLMSLRVANDKINNEPAKPQPVASQTHASHESRPAQRVPAHYETPPSLTSLGPTLAPERFIGKTKTAYQVARKIPQTLAQLPCYCHCDQSVGHKSLHSCFEDEHAASCAVCVDEALLAYKLETEAKLTPKQVREAIIAKYSAAQ